MRAFLTFAGNANKQYEHFGSSWGDMAEREARAILAETEAGGESFTYGHHRFEGDYLKTELSRDYNRQGVAELAESLAAFLEQEI